jgi:hypothetical protein
MSVEDIIKSALANEPVQMKKAFDEEIQGRVHAALTSKYEDMAEAKVEENEDEDEDDEDEEEDQVKKKKDDDEEDDDE